MREVFTCKCGNQHRWTLAGGGEIICMECGVTYYMSEWLKWSVSEANHSAEEERPREVEYFYAKKSKTD